MCHNEVYKCLVCELLIGQDTEHCAASVPILIANECVNYCRREDTCDSWVISSKESGLDVKTSRGTGLFTKAQTFPVYTDSGLLLYVHPHNFLQVDVICRCCKEGPVYQARPRFYENQCNWVFDPFGSPFPVAKIRWEECRDTSDPDYGRPARWVMREVVPGLGFYGTDREDEFQKARRRRPLQPTYECKIQAYPLERVLFMQAHPASVYCYTAPPSEMWGGYDPARSPPVRRQRRSVNAGSRPTLPQAVVNGPDSGYGSQTQPFGHTMEAPADMSPPHQGMFGPLRSNFADSTYVSRSCSFGNMLQLPADMPEAHPGMFGPLRGTIFAPAPLALGADMGIALASLLPQPSSLGGQELQNETAPPQTLFNQNIFEQPPSVEHRVFTELQKFIGPEALQPAPQPAIGTSDVFEQFVDYDAYTADTSPAPDDHGIFEQFDDYDAYTAAASALPTKTSTAKEKRERKRRLRREAEMAQQQQQ